MDFLLPFIRAYTQIFTQPFMAIFTLLAAAQVYGGLRQLRRAWPRRAEWVKEPLRPWKKAVSEQVAFYVAVPISVFIHEVFHVLPVWAFGGKIVEFGFFFFWGYVLPDRVFPELWQEWVISFAGTVGSLLFGLSWWLLSRSNQSSAVRHLGKRVLRFQIYFSLVYYPIFTAVLSIGDWRTIYDFGATPRLAGATAIVHVAVLLLSWGLEKKGWFDAATFQSEEERALHEELQVSAENRPEDLTTQLALVDSLVAKDSLQEAVQLARSLVQRYPDSAEANIVAANTIWDRGDHVPRDVLKFVQKAQFLGLSKPFHQTSAERILGVDALGRGKFEAALTHFDNGLAIVSQASEAVVNHSMKAYFEYMRADVFSQQSKNEAAISALNNALQHARAANATNLIAQIQRRIDILK